VRYRVEHFRAVDSPGTALGYDYAPTGQVEEIDAHDRDDAAAAALTTGDEPESDDVVDYDPGRDLYAVPGEDEAVRVTALT